MNIAIIGAGGVGGYIGAKLILSGQSELSLIARGEHYEAIKQNGLTVLDEDEKFNISSSFISDDLELGAPYDLVLFATKAYSFEAALRSVDTCINKNTILMAIANGVGYKEQIKKIYPSNRVCEAAIYILSNIKEYGVIKKYGGVFKLIIGSEDLDQRELQELYDIFSGAKLNTKISENIALDCWKKYLFISSFATLTSFYDTSIGEIVRHHENELSKVLSEIIAVANKMDIALTNKHLIATIEQAKTQVPFNATTSMLLDFRASRHTELEALCGYIVTQADRLGIKAPLMQKFYEGLQKKEIS